MTEPIDFQLVDIHVLHHMSYSYHFPDVFISDLVSSGLVDGFSQALHLASDDFPNAVFSCCPCLALVAQSRPV